jgi:hypothetical protein
VPGEEKPNEGREKGMRNRNKTKRKKENTYEGRIVSLQLDIQMNVIKVRISSFPIEKKGKLFYKTFLEFRKKTMFFLKVLRLLQFSHLVGRICG